MVKNNTNDNTSFNSEIPSVMADESREQRMARYKEERRRQLAAQFGRRDVGMSADLNDPAYGIRSTRASRLRSAAASANNGELCSRHANKRDPNGLSNTYLSSSPGTTMSTPMSNSYPATIPPSKEKSPPLVPFNFNSNGTIVTSTPRKERDKSTKRKSNLNRQLNTEEVAQVLSDNGDGSRRRRNRVAPTVLVYDNRKSLSPQSSSTNISGTYQSINSPKRLTPPRKISERNTNNSYSSSADNEQVVKVSSRASSRSTPSPPASRIPRKIASANSLFSSSSTESSPRHKPRSHREPLLNSSPNVNNILLTSVPNQSSEIVDLASCSSATPYSVSNCNLDLKNTTSGDLELNSNISREPFCSPRHIGSALIIEQVKKKSPSSSIDDGFSSTPHTPISILKRKSTQDEGSISTAPPPVTFSPSVVDPCPGRRQGILKKHRSLDENEVMRRRSCSPDVESTDFKPILKHQRRSSLEELHRRTISPEPQSILKRKSSREESLELSSTSQPQGILKRKTSVKEETPGHISLADTILLSITGCVPNMNEDDIKPILKKKSFSGEEAYLDNSESVETPKPILKKKTSIDSDEVEEKQHVKPILKLRKDHVISGSAFAPVNKDSISNDWESDSSGNVASNVVPILKKPETDTSSHSMTEQKIIKSNVFNKTVFRRNTISSFSDSRLEANKRRSSEVIPTVQEYTPPPRPVSVAERVMNMETFLASEGYLCEEPSSRLVSRRTRERFHTQPVTALELGKSKCLIPPSKEDNLEVKTNSTEPLINTQDQSNSSSSDINRQSPIPEDTIQESDFSSKRRDSVVAKVSSFNNLETQMKRAAEEARSRRQNRAESRRMRAECQARFATQPVTGEELEEAIRQNDPASNEEDTENDPSNLSLAERVKLFDKKLDNEKLQINRPVRSTRFKTQPVTTEEMTIAKVINSTASKFSSTNSSILVSGLLKNISEKSGIKPSSSSTSIIGSLRENKRSLSDASESSDDDSSDNESVTDKKSTHKTKTALYLSSSRTRREKDSECLTNLKSVLKKDAISGDNAPDKRNDLHSILKSGRNKKDCLRPRTAANEFRVEDNDENNDATNFDNRSRKAKNLDIVGLLHKVEAEAKSVISSKEVMIKKCSSETAMNLKNLSDKSVSRKIRKTRDKEGDSSEGDTTSSGGREIRRINNEAIARRRQAALARLAVERVNSSYGICKSKSQSSIDRNDANDMVNGGGETSVMGGVRRSLTQPMPPSNDTVDEPMTIAQRLAALHKNGESSWKKRISKLDVEDELPTINISNAQKILKKQLTTNESQNPADTTVTSSNGLPILSERLGQLQSSTEVWKKRVEPSDAVLFSVAGRMSSNSPPLLTSPMIERKKKPPRPARFCSRNRSSTKEAESLPTSPEASRVVSFSRSISAPNGEGDSSLSPIESDIGDDLNRKQVKVQTVPKELDENFSSFFTSAKNISNSVEKIDIRDEDLELITSECREILVQTKRIKVQRRHEASGNPLKNLAARKDITTEYLEVKSGIAEREMRRLNVEKLSKNSNLAVEALAGLASKEDFTSVSLRKATSSPVNGAGAMLPYKDLMLLHIKGRRHVQTRLVEPHYSSVNQGDSYVLVTPSEVYQWVGEYSNVIEKSRSNEVAHHVQQKKDLGCNTAANVIFLNGGVPCSNNHIKFWKLLGAGDELASEYSGTPAGHPDEDELYESAIIDTNMMYYVEDDELVPIQKFWGGIPSIEILNPSKIIVFDFGSELYVWMGKTASMDKRKSSLKLAEELWSNGYDYTECDLCPVNAAKFQGYHSDDKLDNSDKKGERPNWGLIAKVTQHMETVLFREKFLDWPDFSRVIRTRRKSSKMKKTDGVIELKPCNAQDMLDWVAPAADLQLDGNHLGRGRRYFDEETRRVYEVTTQSVNVWHIEEFNNTELSGESVGQFYSDDSYVIRWLYNITVTGRELSGQPSKHATTGRNRCAYFIWQGSGATLNDQGAAALITVQLDKERGPQVRIPQGSETPAFLSLFNGTAVIHQGKRGQSRNSVDWRLYICKGEENQECLLTEVPCSIRSLRSRASFVLVNVKEGSLYLWHGAKTLSHTREVASYGVETLTCHGMSDFGLEEFDKINFTEIDEGSEPYDFFDGLGGCNRQLYISLMNSNLSYEWTLKMFHLSSMMGQFKATPVIPPQSHQNLDSPFPYSQQDLYSARQPALFLLDAQDIVWLWQGWIISEESTSSDTEEQEEIKTSLISSNSNALNSVRWQAERKAAMGTALDIWRIKHGEDATPKVYLAYAGLEPLDFTNLFPIWIDRDDIAEINITDGRKPGELLNVEEELTRLTRSTYPVAQLLQRPLPEAIDPTRLEIYLSMQDFQELLGMSKDEFAELPSWKQTNLKKSVGLF